MTSRKPSNTEEVVQALLQEASAITDAAHRLDAKSVDLAVEILEQCK